MFTILPFILFSCEHQYLAVRDAELIAGTPQYAYSDVWSGTVSPTYTVTEGSLDFFVDPASETTSSSSSTVEIDFSAAFEFSVTEIVFFGLVTGDSKFGDHWRYVLDDDEIATKKAEIEIVATNERPTREWCSPKHLGTWTCYQRADDGVDGVGLSAAGEDVISLYSILPVTLDSMNPDGDGDGGGECAGYTFEACCGGSTGISVIECAWEPSCACPSGTTDLGFYSDGYRRCGCPS